MQKIKLKNGLTIIYEKKKMNSVAINVLIKVGSNKETKKERGISHFIEHMVFEGTKKRTTSQEIANQIEKIGGELNAYTSNERTCFFVKVLKKHFDIGLDVLADIIQNPLFKEKEIEKEKKIVGKEIDLINDEPRFYQWVLFEKILYKKHPSHFPTCGSKKIIRDLTKKEIKRYYEKYYHPENMIISIVGDIDNWKKKIENKFILKKQQKVESIKIKEPKIKDNRLKIEKRKIANSYLVLGYPTVPRTHPDHYVLEIINGILGRGQSGWMFNEIRGKRGLAYEVGTQHICEKDYGYFAIYLSTDKNKISQAQKIILKQLNKLKNISEQEIKESKTYIEGSYLLEMEENQRLADWLCFWEQIGDVKKLNSFINNIKKVTKKDVKRVVNNYFNKYCLVIIEGK